MKNNRPEYRILPANDQTWEKLGAQALYTEGNSTQDDPVHILAAMETSALYKHVIIGDPTIAAGTTLFDYIGIKIGQSKQNQTIENYFVTNAKKNHALAFITLHKTKLPNGWKKIEMVKTFLIDDAAAGFILQQSLFKILEDAIIVEWQAHSLDPSANDYRIVVFYLQGVSMELNGYADYFVNRVEFIMGGGIYSKRILRAPNVAKAITEDMVAAFADAVDLF